MIDSEKLVKDFNELGLKYSRVALEKYNVLPNGATFLLELFGTFMRLELEEELSQEDVIKYDDNYLKFFEYLMDEGQIIKTVNFSYKYREGSIFHRWHEYIKNKELDKSTLNK